MKHKKLAEQAGFEISSSNFADLGWVWCSDEYPIDEQLERFAELVRADEREACARLCDNVAQRMQDQGEGPTGYIGYVTECANAIRARWQK